MDTATAMAETAPGLVRLLTLASPAFPVGAFSYSHGLERAIGDCLVSDRGTLVAWIGDLLRFGSAWNDAVLIGEAWRCASAAGNLQPLAELAEAMTGSLERHLEAMAQGAAFADAAAAWASSKVARLPEPCPYPVAIGAVTAGQGLALRETLEAFMHGFAANLVQAAVRLVPLGQREGVRAIAALEETVVAVARDAAAASLDDLGSATTLSDLAAMRHETQATRLFRS